MTKSSLQQIIPALNDAHVRYMVVGGIAVGGVFLANWRALGARTSAQPAPQVVTVGAGPATTSTSPTPRTTVAPRSPARVFSASESCG